MTRFLAFIALALAAGCLSAAPETVEPSGKPAETLPSEPHEGSVTQEFLLTAAEPVAATAIEIEGDRSTVAVEVEFDTNAQATTSFRFSGIPGCEIERALSPGTNVAVGGLVIGVACEGVAAGAYEPTLELETGLAQGRFTVAWTDAVA